jgi:hypothetical protein
VRRRTVRQGLSQNGTAWIGDDAPLAFSRIEIKLALEDAESAVMRHASAFMKNKHELRTTKNQWIAGPRVLWEPGEKSA